MQYMYAAGFELHAVCGVQDTIQKLRSTQSAVRWKPYTTLHRKSCRTSDTVVWQFVSLHTQKLHYIRTPPTHTHTAADPLFPWLLFSDPPLGRVQREKDGGNE